MSTPSLIFKTKPFTFEVKSLTMKFSALIIVLCAVCSGCLINIKTIKHKKYTIGFYDQEEYVEHSNNFGYYVNSQKYRGRFAGLRGLIRDVDKFPVVYDSLEPEMAFLILYQPLIDSIERYQEGKAIVTNILKSHYLPLYKENFICVEFYYILDNDGEQTKVRREQFLRKGKATDWITNCKKGDLIPIIYNPDNVKQSYVKLADYYGEAI